MKGDSKKLDNKICIKCGDTIGMVANGGGMICFHCSKCQARYCFEKSSWLIYNTDTCEWDSVIKRKKSIKL